MNECCICMDDMCNKTNILTTECGHSFHTTCMMKNVAYNGFHCPCCRTVIVDVSDVSDVDEDTDTYYSNNEEIISHDDMDERESIYSDITRSTNNDSQEEGEDDITIHATNINVDEDHIAQLSEVNINLHNKPPLDYVVEKMKERGLTYNNLINLLLVDFYRGYDIKKDYPGATEADKIIIKLAKIIDEYQIKTKTENDMNEEFIDFTAQPK